MNASRGTMIIPKNTSTSRAFMLAVASCVAGRHRRCGCRRWESSQSAGRKTSPRPDADEIDAPLPLTMTPATPISIAALVQEQEVLPANDSPRSGRRVEDALDAVWPDVWTRPTRRAPECVVLGIRQDQ